MTTGSFGLLFAPVGTFSIFLMMSRPSITLPNTTCFPSRKSHFAHVTKNWQPLVPGPLFAMERIPGPSCFSLKFSSANIGPYMLNEPVPSPLTKSPPAVQKSGTIKAIHRYLQEVSYRTLILCIKQWMYCSLVYMQVIACPFCAQRLIHWPGYIYIY